MVAAAACAFSMVGVASASAEPPEFQTPNKKTGEFESLKKPVALTEASGSVEVRSTSADLVCAESTGKGKLTGPKTFHLQDHLHGLPGRGSGGHLPDRQEENRRDQDRHDGRVPRRSEHGLGLPSSAAASSGALTSYTCGTSKFTVTGLTLGAVTPRGASTSELDVTYADGSEPEPGCGIQELQLVDGLGPCVHLSVQVDSGPAQPAAMVAVVKKHTKTGHVTLMK